MKKVDIFPGKCLFFQYDRRFQCKKCAVKFGIQMSSCGHKRHSEVKSEKLICNSFFCHHDIITCAHDRCKHPTLSVLDRAETRLGPLSQDVSAPSPQGGMNSLFVVTGPVPFQHSPVVLAVYLNIKDKCELPKNINQAVTRSF